MNIFYKLLFFNSVLFHEGYLAKTTETDGFEAALVENDVSGIHHEIANFVGTNLFAGDGSRQKCFSSEDIAALAARRDFEVNPY